MELIDQKTKAIMEGCKERAQDAGLQFSDETLEYIVTNRDLLELSPKIMIPTLYDYWVHELEVLQEEGRYELYPNNPYETVINTRPPISYYNDNNPDWLNVMIFYHVLAHIDFFQNNCFFRHTWDYDFTGQALSDKRTIAKLRAEKGRWVDYVIEFARGIDNLAGYFSELSRIHSSSSPEAFSKRLNFYFDVFIQLIERLSTSEYTEELRKYNELCKEHGEKLGERSFFDEIRGKYPEFESLFQKSLEAGTENRQDLLQFVMENSVFLNKYENGWMKQVIEIVRKTSVFFQPQIRTKIMNEGWASYWHEALFLEDDRIGGHEVDFARVHANVTAMPRIGLNPYALGMRLFSHIRELGDKGRDSLDFRRLENARARQRFDSKAGEGKSLIMKVRENFCDFTFIYTFLDQDFVTKNKLFVAGKRLSEFSEEWEYYIKSRWAEDYLQMLLDKLYHPPFIEFGTENNEENSLDLIHKFEEKPLKPEWIEAVMTGLEWLWGGPVYLETSEVVSVEPVEMPDGSEAQDIEWERVLYKMKDRQLTKEVL